MPTDQVRGLKAHGSSPAKGILVGYGSLQTIDFPQPRYLLDHDAGANCSAAMRSNLAAIIKSFS
jgi:hypothetical protein